MKTEHIAGHTYHARKGALANAFRYGVDFVFVDPDSMDRVPFLSRNRFNLWSVRDIDHGGPRGQGQGVNWFRAVLAEHGLDPADLELRLLTQPGFLWFRFNPVSFWVAMKDGTPRVIVAEVNNTFGHRHCYFCAQPDFSPINWTDTITADKLMHVSPFQKVAGKYRFNFDFNESEIRIRIDYSHGDQGVLATLTGKRRRATGRSLLGAALRRPFGAARVVALIHWQALILYAKRAPFLKKPAPPEPLLSDSETFRQSAP